MLAPASSTGYGCGEAVATSPADVYFADGCYGRLYEIPLAGGPTTKVVTMMPGAHDSDGAPHEGGVAPGPTSIYVADGGRCLTVIPR